MNYLGNELVYLEEDRVNHWPDRRDRAVRRPRNPDEKVCRPDRFVPEHADEFDGRGNL
ncbi:hypothetical protein [Caproicibacter fermentans]|uniref:Uncharacterized protein n=1 Tax=Caproicibacter fermentans TaxID=2576756 RepID=A0A7G8TFL6_9FIRM|nr:hypothetical protein [Caproicibacter fermentans]QNK42407.1 hypothetical protein HCR03_09465 [Caproicibacter fermentans]